MRNALPTLALLLASTTLAEAATLKPFTSLSGGVVKLSDLFDNLDDTPDKPLGPSPSPGGRIVVESAQLAAIARQFGVAWRPASDGDRAILERAGRSLMREEVLAPLRAALIAAGAASDAEFTLQGFDPPFVPVGAAVDVAVTQVSLQGSGRFSALLSVTSPGIAPTNQPISGEAHAMVTLPVPVRRIAAGEVLTADDLTTIRIRADRVHGAVLADASQAAGLALHHAAPPGLPIPLAELGRPAIIEKGAAVTMSLETGGIALLASGQALDPGAAGDHIRVLNPASRAIVDGEVIGPGSVRLMPGSLPLRPAQHTTLALEDGRGAALASVGGYVPPAPSMADTPALQTLPITLPGEVAAR